MPVTTVKPARYSSVQMSLYRPKLVLSRPVRMYAMDAQCVGARVEHSTQALLAQAQKRIQQVSAGVLAAAILSTAACNQAALADIQTVAPQQALDMAKPMKKQPIDKGKVWIVFVGGAAILYCTTLLVEDRSGWFPAITKANSYLKMRSKQIEAEERRAAEERVEWQEMQRNQDVFEDGLKEARTKVLAARANEAMEAINNTGSSSSSGGSSNGISSSISFDSTVSAGSSSYVSPSSSKGDATSPPSEVMSVAGALVANVPAVLEQPSALEASGTAGGAAAADLTTNQAASILQHSNSDASASVTSHASHVESGSSASESQSASSSGSEADLASVQAAAGGYAVVADDPVLGAAAWSSPAPAPVTHAPAPVTPAPAPVTPAPVASGSTSPAQVEHNGSTATSSSSSSSSAGGVKEVASVAALAAAAAAPPAQALEYVASVGGVVMPEELLLDGSMSGSAGGGEGDVEGLARAGRLAAFVSGMTGPRGTGPLAGMREGGSSSSSSSREQR